MKQDHRAIAAFAARLACGDRRSIGAATAIAKEIQKEPQRFSLVWHLLRHRDPRVRMRAADALERASRHVSEQLRPFKADLLSRYLEDGTPEVRWHLLAMSARLLLDRHEAKTLIDQCRDALIADKSRIARVAALQAAYDLANQHPEFTRTLDDMLDVAARSNIPSLRARARKLRSGEQATS